VPGAGTANQPVVGTPGSVSPGTAPAPEIGPDGRPLVPGGSVAPGTPNPVPLR
jgi:hypothetical protein